MARYDGWDELPTIGDIEGMPSNDGWGKLPTIEDLDEQERAEMRDIDH